MSITKEQQQALDNALVPWEQRLMIRSCNYRLSTTFKPKEPTFQVALDNSSENTKRYSFDLDTFRNMLQICPKLPGKQFVDPPFEEEILTFMRELGYSGNIKLLSDVKGVFVVPSYDSEAEQISWKSSDEEDEDDEANICKDEDVVIKIIFHDDKGDERERFDSDNDGDDFVHPKFSTHDEEDKEEYSFDPRGNEQDEEETNEEVKSNELYRDVNVNLEGRDTKMTNAPHTIIQTTQVIEDTHVIIALVNPEGQQQSSSMSSGFVSNMLNPSLDTCIDSIFNLNTKSTSLVDVPVTTIAETPLSSATTLPPPTIPLITHMQQTLIPTPTTIPSSSLQDLSNFGSLFGFDHRLKTLETDFSEFKQTNQFTAAVSLIPGIIDVYLANKMHEAVKIVVQLQSDRLRDEAQAENADFINKLDDNIKKIIKDQVKEQVKAQVSKILLKTEKTINEQLEAKVLTCSSNKSKTSHAVATNLSELELKKILVDKMESNKSIHKSDKQKNLYKALVDAYESDKLILDTYKDTVLFKRRRDNEDKDEEPSLDQTGCPREEELEKNQSQPKPAKPPTLDRDWNKTLPDAHEPVQPWLSSLAQMEDLYKSFNELMDTPLDFSAFVMNWLKVDTLTPELLAGPTFKLMKGSCKSLVELEYFFEEVYKATTDQLDLNNPEDVYSKRRIIVVTKLQIVERHNYKHLDWITVHRNDDKLYKFKEGDFNRLRIQDIEDMLLLLVQGKLTNLTVEERIAFNNLNLTKPDTYRSDLKRREAYTAYCPRGFIYQNKDKKNRLMCIDELHKFSDGTLNDVRTTLNDRLKGIRMKYLPQTIQRQSDRDKARAMIQAIDKQLKTRRIMRSLEKFVGGSLYEGDF
ncbi:hypothetical protein Tco_0753596 [Tanacetum coccineum]